MYIPLGWVFGICAAYIIWRGLLFIWRCRPIDLEAGADERANDSLPLR